MICIMRHPWVVMTVILFAVIGLTVSPMVGVTGLASLVGAVAVFDCVEGMRRHR